MDGRLGIIIVVGNFGAQMGMNKIIIFILLLILNIKLISLELDDDFIRRYLKHYPEATIFKLDYLDFFSNDSINQKNETIENNGKYILFGDFNNNGKEEIVISGLVSKKIINNEYVGFILILEKEKYDYKIVFFEKLFKQINSDIAAISNIALFYKEIAKNKKAIIISFCIGTGYSAIIEYKNKKYKFKMSPY